MSEESNREALGDDMMNSWNRVIEKRNEEIKNGTYEPCCDENNKCCCNTFSPTYASSKEFNEFIKREYNKQSWQRKLRNIYLGYKYRFEDWIYKIKN